MMRRSSDLIGYGLDARDGSIGSISDLLFDDEDWTIRWTVADTGSWLTGRSVLLPPSSFGEGAVGRRSFPVDLTRRQIEDSPGVETDRPVSRQQETAIYGYYGWSPYWYPPAGMAGGMGVMPMAGAVPYPPTRPAVDAPGTAPPTEREGEGGDAHLRSAQEVTGYYVRATDDDIGHVEDLLVGDDWKIRYVVVDTKNWWPGKKVLVSTDWFRGISWDDRQIRVELTRDGVERSPEYDPSAAVERSYEDRLHRHYGSRPYWA